MGIWGIISVMLLMMLQMVLAFLPGEPIEILAGMCYGTIGGMFVMFAGIFISSSIIFFLSRKLGRPFIYSFFSKEKIDKFENSKLFTNIPRLEFFMLIMFLLPGVPKDIFVYLAALLPIKPLKFLLISTFARFPSIISSTYAGSNLAQGNLKVTIIAFIITFIISSIGILIASKMNKKI